MTQDIHIPLTVRPSVRLSIQCWYYVEADVHRQTFLLFGKAVTEIPTATLPRSGR